MSVHEHASSSMMGAEGFGSESFKEEDVVAQEKSNGSFIQGIMKKNANDPKQMLEVGKEPEKLKAMRAIVQEMARGVDQAEYFPSVVKCVVSKSLELKKLVYMYLVRYAEDLPDLALLSISTFQKGLKDPNQLIRASALRVLSSIRVAVIVPIMLLALKQAATDMSPYVRKTAAHAIPKLYALAPQEKESLVEIVEQLLHDRTTMVLGSVVMAMDEVCPERTDLLHKHYRKLCNTLVDVDEWGQIAIINILIRYARTQFINPNSGNVATDVTEKVDFYGEKSSSSEGEEGEGEKAVVPEAGEKKEEKYTMDPDHRLLLRVVQPLLLSRNAGVVLAVSQVYHYLAPHTEVSIIAKPMIRLLRTHREIQYVVLTSIASIMDQRGSLFTPYLKSFFVHASDPRFVRLLKLEILTSLATEGNISLILREFQQYVKDTDREFVTHTIQCIGRCASKLGNITESCLTGLMRLVSNRDEAIVAESVVVIKKLLQLNPEAHKEIIVMMSKLAFKVTVPMARASILWIIGEYSSHVPKFAPDVLRQMAKSFIAEEDIVKLQIINLAAKLYLTNSKHTKLLTTYVLNLAKYDQNYDIRDRSRMVRALLFTKETKLHKRAKDFFLSEKPAPNLKSTLEDRTRFQMGSLSHVLNQEANGFIPLPDFPLVAPDPLVRNVEEKAVVPTGGDMFDTTDKKKKKKERSERGFYSSSEDSESESEDSTSGSESESESEDDDATSTNSSEEEDEKQAKKKGSKKKKETSSESSEEEFTSPNSSEEEEERTRAAKVAGEDEEESESESESGSESSANSSESDD